MAKKKRKKYAKLLGILGSILIFLSLSLLFLIFWPAVKEEVKYDFNDSIGIKYVVDKIPDKKEKVLTPVNKDFSILIPKIAASASVIANVDYSNPDIFLPLLKKGVAHAKGSSFPDQEGNVYIFAHSTDTFYNVANFNAVFYLLGKLERDDEIIVYYKDQEYVYSVSEIKVVNASDTKYLGKIKEEKTLTLQTCYPPGTTLKRLVVIADFVK